MLATPPRGLASLNIAPVHQYKKNDTQVSFFLYWCGIRESKLTVSVPNERVWETLSSVADKVRDGRIGVRFVIRFAHNDLLPGLACFALQNMTPTFDSRRPQRRLRAIPHTGKGGTFVPPFPIVCGIRESNPCLNLGKVASCH